MHPTATAREPRMNIGIVMNPTIGGITPGKDSSFALLLAAMKRGWTIHHIGATDLYLRDGEAMARTSLLQVRDDPDSWFTLGAEQELPLGGLDLIFMRADPPVDMQYLYMTWILGIAEAAGVPVYNPPGALRNLNEKLAAGQFKEFSPPTLVSMDLARIMEFAEHCGTAVVKPLNSMGGDSVFRISAADPNCDEILRLVTHQGQRYVMVQKFLPEVTQGDKRILLINGEPVPQALLRIPAAGSIRANMVAGGSHEGAELSASDRRICEQLGPMLRHERLLFVGIDVIGEFLTEINITSPTGIRQLDHIYGISIADQVLDAIAMAKEQ